MLSVIARTAEGQQKGWLGLDVKRLLLLLFCLLKIGFFSIQHIPITGSLSQFHLDSPTSVLIQIHTLSF